MKSEDKQLLDCTENYYRHFEHIVDKNVSKIYNLLKLEFSGKALGDSVDEVGEGEGSTTIPE